MLFYRRNVGPLRVHTDASWSNAEKRKSFSRGVIMLDDSLIIWRSGKQRYVGFSTCVVELFACSELVKDITWILDILLELDVQNFCIKPIILNWDNRATVEWISNSRSSSKTRHVNLNFHFIKNEIENGNLKISYVESKNMIADFLTKAMTKDKLSYKLIY